MPGTQKTRSGKVLKSSSIIQLLGRPLVIEAAHSLGLSKREIDLILALLENADNSAEIAFFMRVSPGTARAHFANIFRKTGYSTRLAVAITVISEALRKKLQKQNKP
jgi:DNA-binding NarL/FixJ family response regulator